MAATLTGGRLPLFPGNEYISHPPIPHTARSPTPKTPITMIHTRVGLVFFEKRCVAECANDFWALRGNSCPHPWQKRKLSRFSVLHFGQRIVSHQSLPARPLQLRIRAAIRWSSAPVTLAATAIIKIVTPALQKILLLVRQVHLPVVPSPKRECIPCADVFIGMDIQ